jgi:N4-gp56 family major capsid protein
MAYTGTATSGTGMSALMQVYFQKVALETLMANTVLYDQTDKVPLPANNGKTVVFHRYIARSTTVSAYTLTEGGSGAFPTGNLLSATSVSATVVQYGDYVSVSDFLDMTAVSDVVKDAVQQMSMNAADIIDRKTFEVAYGTSSIPSGAGFLMSYANPGYSVGALSTVTSACTMNVASIRGAIKDLKTLNAKPKSGGYFNMTVHPATASNLMGDSAWAAAYQYTTPENLRTGNIGRIFQTEVYETSLVYNTTSGVGTASGSAYFSVILGQGSLGATNLGGSNMQIIVKNPNQYATGDPLDQFSTIAWKIAFAPVIFNPSAGRILVTMD